MLVSDRVSGGCIALLGAVAAFAGSRLPAVPGQEVGPAVFPLLVGSGLVLCGVLVAFGVGHSFEAPEEETLAAPTLPDRLLLAFRALLPAILLLFYVFAVDWLGFLLTAFVMVGAAALALGAAWRLALPLALLAPIGAQLVFGKLLRVPLPDGLLPVFW